MSCVCVGISHQQAVLGNLWKTSFLLLETNVWSNWSLCADILESWRILTDKYFWCVNNVREAGICLEWTNQQRSGLNPQIKPTVWFPGHQSAPGKHSDPGDPGFPGERPGGEGSEETLQPGPEESAAGRVPQGESSSLWCQRSSCHWQLGHYVFILGSNANLFCLFASKINWKNAVTVWQDLMLWCHN